MTDTKSKNDGPIGTDEVEAVCLAGQRLLENVEKVIVGKQEAVTLILIALLCEGHVILEDVPGVGKTLLAKAVARSLEGSFKRIQFTSDLLPSDVTGLNYFNQKTGEFEYLAGPILANVVLADEINRATPRTQACLLEAMAERQVTVDGSTRPLPRPFMVLATQNPVEQSGTFPLPEAQLDRFLMRIHQGYPSAEAEEAVILRFERSDPLETLGAVVEGRELTRLGDMCRRVFVEPSVRAYLVDVVRATREYPGVRLGASPRAAQALYRAAQARAALSGRGYVLPDDVKILAGPVLAHRLLLDAETRLRGRTREDLTAEIAASRPVPVE